MTPSEIFALMVADTLPMPPFAAVDRVIDESDDTADVSDAVYLLFQCAGDHLLTRLGSRPEHWMQGDSYARMLATESIEVLWELGAELCMAVKRQVIPEREFDVFRAHLEHRPGLSSLGIVLSIRSFELEGFSREVARVFDLLSALEKIEGEQTPPALVAGTPQENSP